MIRRAYLTFAGIILAVLLPALILYPLGCQKKDPTEPAAKQVPPKPANGTEKPSEPASTPEKLPPRANAWKPLYQASLDRSVKWLLDNQHDDGRWGHFLPQRPQDIYIGEVNSLKAFGNASSALCCMALLMQPSVRGSIISYALQMHAESAARLSITSGRTHTCCKLFHVDSKTNA